MRQLHVLGVSDDGQALLLGPLAGKASHRLPLDDKLRAAVRGQLSAVGVERAESALSPKEMQARMREGATPEEVAKEAQVPVARVLPYAAPVIAERERIVEQARAAVVHRSRGPNGQRPLGEVVDAHLGDTAGLKEETVEWTARRRRDGAWVVLLSYLARGGRRSASWLWRPVERDLTTLDSSATRLASEESSAPRRKAAAVTKKSTRRPAAKKVAKKAAKKTAKAARSARKSVAKPRTRQATAKKTTARKPVVRQQAAPAKAAPKPATRKPAATKATAKKTATRKTATRKLTAAKPAATRATVRKAAPKPAAAVRKPRKQVEPEATPIRPTVVPDPVVVEAPSPVVVIHSQPEPEPAPQPEAPAAVARRRGERVPLPSWSDVLLGVAPPEITRESPARRKRKSG